MQIGFLRFIQKNAFAKYAKTNKFAVPLYLDGKLKSYRLTSMTVTLSAEQATIEIKFAHSVQERTSFSPYL